MKPKQTIEYVKQVLGVEIAPFKLAEWAKEGLLGEVVVRKQGHKDYSSTNAQRVVICTMLSYFKWRQGDIKKLLVDKDILLKERVKEDLVKFQTKFLSAIKQLELDKVIG